MVGGCTVADAPYIEFDLLAEKLTVVALPFTSLPQTLLTPCVIVKAPVPSLTSQ